MNASTVQVHPITPGRRVRGSTPAPPQCSGQSRSTVAPATFSAPMSTAALVPRPRRARDLVLTFSH
jgi:hypothetical protein